MVTKLSALPINIFKGGNSKGFYNSDDLKSIVGK